ncbi:MAG: P-loop containing nucleoside triphosphate hydrolase protein [Monoraphidium minutum]|nr:MAG: P-loop containing nucleoside triphosphate hydrolase protein [Monoraphidium minutum]
MDDDVALLTKGSRVWYRSDASTWLLAELRDAPAANPAAADPKAAKKGVPAATAPITLLSGAAVGKPVDDVPTGQLVPANAEVQASIPDMTQLSYLNEPSILGNLQLRYAADKIYTCAGPVLIALNPCKELPVYTEEVQHAYKAVAHESLHSLDPHVYLVAGAAYRAMVREGASQSIVINGESGAGKTETTKRAMKFLASLAGGPGRVEERVLETNPVLEAFGNAKTLRNHNSSRFGKLVEIHFNQTHHICGARIRTYLLEKSRVVHQLPGERSYHIFYQLVRGADKRQRAAFKLPSKPQDFKYLAQSGCLDIAGVNDGKDFTEVCTALADVGVSPEQQDVLFATLSGVLWLGNVKIAAVTDDSSKVEKDAALEAAAALLGVTQDTLAHALTHKKIRTRDELIVKPLNKEEAADARDALAKAVYAGVFRWVVTRINESLDTGRRGSGQFIAILDIYGFECFTTNSFEQLCINYANEALQQQFTQHLFTLEQEEYMSEGIDWTKARPLGGGEGGRGALVEWTDNSACLDAIDALPPRGLGVLAVLDSQCKFPKATDDTFVTALRDALASNAIFSTDPRRPDQFLLSHYAGPVAYSAANFLEKNKDALSPDLMVALGDAASWLVAHIGATLAEEAEGQGRRGGGTVSSRFSSQLKELLAMLDVTGLHFVRCIKPNAALTPGSFSPELVLGQLRCCGVLEVARVSRAGFPTRYPHAAFVERYRVMLPRAQQAALGGGGGRGVRDAIVTLLDAFGVKPGQYEIGHTKVFFRPGVLAYVEDRWARVQESSLRIQAFWRMWRARSSFHAHRAAAATLQAAWRGRAARVPYGQRVREHRAATRVQAGWRGAAARGEFTRKRAAVVTIQMAARRRALGKRVAARAADRAAREAAEEAEAAELAAAAALSRAAGDSAPEQVAGALALQEAAVGSLKQQLLVERAARQRYASQLEQQAIEWMEQVRVLKEHIDTLRARMPAGGAGAGFPSTPPGARAPVDPATAAAVSALSSDFMGKAPLFEDDADFIAEVADGASHAPGMDPQSELDLLRRKYDAWNKGFKERLRTAQAALRTVQRHRGHGGGGGGGGGGPGPIDLSSMPDLSAPGLLGDEPGTARSGDSWDGPGGGGGGGGAPKKKKGLFGLRG